MIESLGGAMEQVGKNLSERSSGFWEKLESSSNIEQPTSVKETQAAKEFWKGLESGTQDGGKAERSAVENEATEKKLEEAVGEYVKDLKDKSECPETIPDRPFEASDLEKLSPEEVAKRREEFSEIKPELKKQWEEAHGMPWPKYEHDVYSANGKLIRKAGSDYDAHHIQPLGMGGKNEVKNITPLNAEVHYDKQGVHSPDSPYTRLDKMLGGADS